jgi:phospholipid/cholesterol/gamma-HCH transport system permease protein
MVQSPGNNVTLTFTSPDPDTLRIILAGPWLLRGASPPAASVVEQLDANQNLRTVAFDGAGITVWDTGLLVFLSRVIALCGERRLSVDRAGLPAGVRTLLDLAAAVPEADRTIARGGRPGVLQVIGNFILHFGGGFRLGLQFTGEVVLSFLRLLRGKAQFRAVDLFLIVEQTGPNALPVVSLVSFLVGLILAYMGAAQLERVGAEIYIADLVAIGMVREIAALMTGVIMAGRTGAAYAAEIGTMNVNEELDAFRILGISVIDFLVLPRLLALVLMIPLLTLYSGLVGILAGMTVSVLVFDFTLYEYYQQTLRALELKQFGVGLFKGTAYGIVVALSGCLRGLQCGRSALAVGQATTSAVVTSIVYIVVVASALTIVFYKLGI